MMGMEEGCLFCKMVSGEVPAEKVYEDENFLAFLDIKPINLGHTLIIPKTHSRNIFDLSDHLLARIGPLMKRMSIAVKEATGAEGINIGWNNELSAGQLIFHSHIHIMPRFSGDGYKHWLGQDQHTPEEFSAIGQKIRTIIS